MVILVADMVCVIRGTVLFMPWKNSGSYDLELGEQLRMEVEKYQSLVLKQISPKHFSVNLI